LQVEPSSQHRGAGAPESLPYIPGLDGLRALAVAAVLLYHADLPVYGGFLGVESFFVISGFLITALLLHDHAAHGRVRLGHFWWRRARRLLPALFALLAGVALITALRAPAELRDLAADTLAALAYATNWHLIAGGQSYFDAADRPPLLQHLWSLAVEEQFYIVWPLVFAAAMARLGRRGLLALALLGAAASVGLMALLHDPGADPSRIYYGTDTRAGGILLGVALAFVWAPGRAPALASRRAGAALDAAGLVALGGLLVAYAALGEVHPLLYRGGLPLVALATAALVAAATHPSARLLPRLFELAPLRWLGVRSYSLYLWHWPVLMLTRPGVDVPAGGWALQAARIGLAVGLAALSYRFVELPVRRGALERAWAALRGQGTPAAPPLWRRSLAPLAGTVALSLGLSYIGASIAQAAVRQSHIAPPARRAVSVAAPHPAAGRVALAAPEAPTAAAAPHASAPPASAPVADATPTPPRVPAVDPAVAAELQAALDAAVAGGEIPGATLSVRLSDGSTWTGAAGLADREATTAMTPATRVRIGSLSKLFTAVTTLQLVEEGRLDLDAPVATWLPDLLPDGDAITVRQLLQHTSGLYDYLEDRRFVARAYADPDHQWAPEELVAYANGFPPSFAPGEGWDYSNTNFVVLGLLIERVAGSPLAAELDRRIFTPLGLEQTYAVPPDSVDGPEARGHSRSEDLSEVSLSFAFGTANLVTTADDLRRFGEALFDGELLGPATMAQMQTFVDGKGQYDMPDLQYGLGLMSNRLPVAEDVPVLGHIGGINGFRAAMWYSPEHDILIALAVNQGATDPNELAEAVFERILAAPDR
jgi:peptidoglycan/LPS O-acetylase OafA/YrhL/CubicO group peptidase (beta-lactamase class C family)